MDSNEEFAPWMRRKHRQLINRRTNELVTSLQPALRRALAKAAFREVGAVRDPAAVDQAVQDALAGNVEAMLVAAAREMVW